jgi:hypothetical protein
MIIYLNRSVLSGKEGSMEIPLSEQEFAASYNSWKSGVLIQEAFPTLTAQQREFLMTGITPEEWSKVFGEEEE